MIEKFFSKIPLTEAEKKLLIRITLISLIGCFGIAAATWTIQFVRVKAARPAPHADGAGAGTEMSFDPNNEMLPIDEQAHLFAARHFLKTDRPLEAIPHLLRLQPARKNDRSLQFTLATAYLQSGQYTKARRHLEQLDDPDIADTLTDKIIARHGLVLFYLNQTQSSIEKLQTCIKSYPEQAECACYLGQVYAAISVPSDKAEQYLHTALDIRPNYTEALYQLSRYYMQMGTYGRARSLLLKVLEIEPLHVKAHSRLGMVYYYLEQPEQAEKSYQTALALNPRDYNTLYNLGELYFSSFEDMQRALNHFTKTLEIEPGHPEANFKVGLICLHNNMNKEAVKYLERARSGAPDNIRFLLQLGVAYEKMEMKQEALALYRTIKELDGLNRIALQKIKTLSSP